MACVKPALESGYAGMAKLRGLYPEIPSNARSITVHASVDGATEIVVEFYPPHKKDEDVPNS